MKINIGDKTYNVLTAKTEEEQIKGLQGVKSLSDNEGMLFIYDEPEDCDFWMKGCDLTLDIIFIDDDCEVISVAKAFPNDETFHSEKDVKYVLEVNQNSGIEKGDILELDDLSSLKLKPNVIHVLDAEGKSQMELKGAERIFSRISTKRMVALAKQCYTSKNDKNEYEKRAKKLGDYVFKELTAQDNRDPQYVQK